MDDFTPTDDTGRPIGIGDVVKLTNVAGPPLGRAPEPGVRYLLGLEGVIVGIDELDQWGNEKGRGQVWLRLDGDRAIVSIHPSRMRVMKAAR